MSTLSPLRGRLKFKALSQPPAITELVRRGREHSREPRFLSAVRCSSSCSVLAEFTPMAILGRSARSHLTVQRQWPRSKVTEVEVSDRAGVGTTKPHCLKPRTESHHASGSLSLRRGLNPSPT